MNILFLDYDGVVNVPMWHPHPADPSRMLCTYNFSFRCSPSVKHKSFSREFWSTYRRRMTKTIAKVMRDIDNNPNNWYYMEVKRGDLD